MNPSEGNGLQGQGVMASRQLASFEVMASEALRLEMAWPILANCSWRALRLGDNAIAYVVCLFGEKFQRLRQFFYRLFIGTGSKPET